MRDQTMIEVTDHLKRKMMIPDAPQRIISLCPSITETLFALGLSERIIGRTRYCIHPADEVENVQVVGGTKQVHFDRIDALAPDLIIVEKEENPKDMVEQLAQKYPVFVTNVENVPEALQMIRDVGRITGTVDIATNMIEHIEKDFQMIACANHQTVAYLIWRKPYMVVGAPTYIDSMLEQMGLDNRFSKHTDRYPVVTIEELKAIQPDFLFLSSEPFPFTEEHKNEFAHELPNTRIMLVDGEIFSWYGARMIKAPIYMNELISKLTDKR